MIGVAGRLKQPGCKANARRLKGLGREHVLIAELYTKSFVFFMCKHCKRLLWPFTPKRALHLIEKWFWRGSSCHLQTHHLCTQICLGSISSTLFESSSEDRAQHLQRISSSLRRLLGSVTKESGHHRSGIPFTLGADAFNRLPDLSRFLFRQLNLHSFRVLLQVRNSLCSWNRDEILTSDLG